MRILTLLVTLAVFVLIPINAAHPEAPDFIWAKRAGGPATGEGEHIETGFDVIIDSFCPSKAFSKVDLPEFGKPRIAT